MVVVRPFKALRPKKELAEAVASFPYDVINSEEAKALATGNPYSFLHVVKPEIDLPGGIDLYDESVYQRAKSNLLEMISKGVMSQDDGAYLYIYRQIMDGHEQYGIVGVASSDDYNEDRIKKHEFTRQAKEDDRTKHVITLNANTGPVFLTYRDHSRIDQIIADFVKGNVPEVDFTKEDGIQHTVWVVSDQSIINTISGIFNDEIDTLYVADGHHRSASAARAKAEKMKQDPNYNEDKPYNFFLSVFFPASQLKILDYNRVLFGLNGLDKEAFLAAVGKKFVIEMTGEASPKKATEFGMYLDHQWYTITAKSDSFPGDDPVLSLDVAILQNNLLTPILGIGDPRVDKHIDFVGGIRGTEELKKRVDSGECKVAFSLYPTGIDQLMSVADAGQIMPPKSTWFEPKLRSGLFVHLLD